MERLHAGDNAEFSEPRNIGRGNGFDVLNARAAILSVIAGLGALISVESHANCVVPDGVRENLEALLIKLGDRSRKLVRLPEKRSFHGRVIAVRLQHGGRMCLDDAIQAKFYCIARKPIAGIFFPGALDSLKIRRAQGGGIEKISDTHAKTEIAALSHFLVEIQVFEIPRSKVAA